MGIKMLGSACQYVLSFILSHALNLYGKGRRINKKTESKTQVKFRGHNLFNYFRRITDNGNTYKALRTLATKRD